VLAGKVLNEGSLEFQFEVGDGALAFPDLYFRKPITVIGPKGTVDTPREELKFIWGPHPAAVSYRVSVSEIIKRGTTTRFEPVAVVEGIQVPYIDYPDLMTRAAVRKSEACYPEPKEIERDRLYGVRIVAYDKDHRVLTASSDIGPELTAFTLK
jgi:hypothetical protein